MSTARTWGTTAAERAKVWPCDDVLTAEDSYFRGVDVLAEPDVVFRWLCQLRVAPYSYDLVDNLGRRSPRSLTPGLDDLEVGQTFMTIFELVSFTPDVELTLLMTSGVARWLFGRVAVTYRVIPAGRGVSRLLAKVNVAYPGGVRGQLLRRALPWGDLAMMRKQLLNVQRLAESGEKA